MSQEDRRLVFSAPVHIAVRCLRYSEGRCFRQSHLWVVRRIGLAAPAWEELLVVHRNSVGRHTDHLAAGIAVVAEGGRIGLDSDHIALESGPAAHIALESGPADLAPRRKMVPPVGEHNCQKIAGRRSSDHR